MGLLARLSRNAALLVLLVPSMATVALDADSVAACSCAVFTDEEVLARADVVFVGRLVGIRIIPRESYSSTDPEEFVFEVNEVYKGSATATQSVFTARDGASCGLEISGPGSFLVFGTRGTDATIDGGAGRLWSNLCSGTRPLSTSPIPDSFGQPAPPGSTVDPPPITTTSVPSSDPPTTAAPVTTDPVVPPAASSGNGGAGRSAAVIAMIAVSVAALAGALALFRRARGTQVVGT